MSCILWSAEALSRMSFLLYRLVSTKQSAEHMIFIVSPLLKYLDYNTLHIRENEIIDFWMVKTERDVRFYYDPMPYTIR